MYRGVKQREVIWIKILMECENTNFITNLIEQLNISNQNIKIYNIIYSTNNRLNSTYCKMY